MPKEEVTRWELEELFVLLFNLNANAEKREVSEREEEWDTGTNGDGEWERERERERERDREREREREMEKETERAGEEKGGVMTKQVTLESERHLKWSDLLQSKLFTSSLKAKGNQIHRIFCCVCVCV